MRVFPQLFRILPNCHKCFYNSIETRSTCFLFLFRKHRNEKKENNLLTTIIKMKILFARAITTSTARASSVSPSSYTNTIFNQSTRVLSQDCFLNSYLVIFSHIRSLSSRRSACITVFFARFRKSVDQIAQASSRCLHYLPAAMLEDQGAPPTWRLHTKLYDFAQNISTNISTFWQRTYLSQTQRNVFFIYRL